MKTKYWICFVLLFAVAGCKNECDDYDNYYALREVTKPYLFKEGTYWIYQNTITGEIDSEYVSRVNNYSDTTNYIKYTCGINYSVHEGTEMVHRSSKEPSDSIVWFSVGSSSSSTIGVEKNGKINVLLFLENKNTNLIGCLSYKGFFDQMNVINHTFYSVDCFAIKSEQQCNGIYNYATDFYFAPHFGVIKKVEYNTPNGTQEWNLIRWKIVQ